MLLDVSKIAVVIYDNVTDEYEIVKRNLHDFTLFAVQYSKYDIFIANNLTQTINELIEKYNWAVVIATGNHIKNISAIEDTVNHAISANSPLACHILDKGGYFHFDPQWFAIDLNVYKSIGAPAFEEDTTNKIVINTRETIRSLDNVHDDYTPWFLNPGEQDNVTYYSCFKFFGTDIVSELIRNRYHITNIPNIVRNVKTYIYPNQNANDISQALMDRTNSTEFMKNLPVTNELVWLFVDTVQSMIRNLEQAYFVLNTENIKQHNLTTEFDCFVGVCGGIKPVILTGQENFKDTSRIYLIDISQAALDWQKYLINHWHGDILDFEAVYKTFQSLNSHYFPILNGSIDKILNEFLASANLTREEFQSLWIKYKNKEHYFIKMNLLEDDAADKIIDMITGSSAYIWTSNSFFMDYIMFYYGRNWSKNKTVEFVQKLINKSHNNIVLENCGKILPLTASMDIENQFLSWMMLDNSQLLYGSK